MKKQKGVHFYINILNFNSIIKDEEEQTRKVTHSIHALDTFFTSVERYGKTVSKSLVVEKITGSRLHLYVTGEIGDVYDTVKKVSSYAYKLARYLNRDIPKYKSLKDFYINVGVAYGKFYEFEFKTKEYDELTTIGYAANFAAKLLALSGYNKLSISEDIYDSLSSEDADEYTKIEEESIRKYDQERYYTIALSDIATNVEISEDDLSVAKDYANSDNLGDIDFASVRVPLNFQTLSKKQCKELVGIPVFADVRDFTSQFAKDDSNLEEMAAKTQQILESMYQISSSHGGIHVQFQGDRELSLYHNVPGQIINGIYQDGQKCFKYAVLASMRMIDAVKSFKVNIGVGEDFGRLFATKLGARGEKDNILLGETVIQADYMEDKIAAKTQIAITTEVYDGLKEEDPFLAEQFSKIGQYYIATIGYEQYKRKVSYKQQITSTYQKNYNGAWGDL